MVFGLLAFLVSAGAALTFKIESDSSLARDAVQEKARIERRIGSIISFVRDIVSDVRLVANATHLQRFLASNVPSELEHFERDIEVFVAAKSIYDQVRYIDESGMERVRVDMDQGRPLKIAQDQLQNKGQRYFFLDTMTLAQGEIYISPFDLNVEAGKVEMPFRPMIRLATPLFDPAGQRRGIAILNYRGNDLLARLNRAGDASVEPIELLNRDGFWLKSRYPADEWGFMLGRTETLATMHPDIWQRMQSEASGQMTSGGTLWTWSRIYPLQQGVYSSSGSAEPVGGSQASLTAGDYYWIALSRVERGMLSPNELARVVRYGVLWCVALMLAWCFSWAIALRQGRLNVATAQLIETRSQSEHILSAAGEGICGVDAAGHPVFINAAARRMLGWTEEDGQLDVPPEIVACLTPAGGDGSFQGSALDKTLRDGSYRQVLDDSFRRKDGTAFPVEYTVSPIKRDGQITGAVMVFRDVSERRRIEGELARYRDHLEAEVQSRTAELRLAKEAAETANVAKSAFLANMSHEMRTPLHQVGAMAELILLESLTPKQTDRLDKLMGACNRLESIISSILSLTWLEAGKLELQETVFDVRQFVDEALANLREKAALQHRRLEVDVSGLQSPVIGDTEYLARALGNYVDNALRFSETGSIVIRAKELERDEQSTLIRFEVEDQGEGIAAEDLPKLFRHFEQIDNSSTRHVGGLGVGLATTRKIASIMGGEAGCSSERGKGSLFWFTVRLKTRIDH
ncbi:MAG: putative Histidine kinase [Proteobacteria bacterium]|nr:putative Histidine kinase [Pseudomonadota bacterium]